MLRPILNRSPLGAILARLTILSLLAALPAFISAQTNGLQPNAGVSVLFNALDKDGKAVNGIKAEDVKLSVNGTTVQSIGLKKQDDGPVFFTIAIDTSASEERMLPNTKAVAGLFIKSMMRPGLDKAAIVTFTGDMTIEQDMTGDMNKVLEAVGRVAFVPPSGYVGGGIIVGNPPPTTSGSGGSTGIWDTVAQIGDKVMPRSLGAGRRVLLLITDGEDTSSSMKSNKAIAVAVQSGMVVYPIGIGDNYFDGVDKNSLRKIAERTGGHAFFPKKVADITESFKQISESLSSQYIIIFAPTSAAHDGSFHKLKIEIVNRSLREQGVELAYPQGYYAGNTPTAVKK